MSDNEELLAETETGLGDPIPRGGDTASPTKSAASTGINATTSAPVSTTASVMTEAHMPTDVHITMVDQLTSSGQRVVASTPLVSTGNNNQFSMLNQNPVPGVSPSRTRSGLLRLAHPQKRPRIPRAISINNNISTERAPHVTWASSATALPINSNARSGIETTVPNLSAQFSGLGMGGNVMTTASHRTQGEPYSFNAPSTSTLFRFGANSLLTTQNHYTNVTHFRDSYDTRQHSNIFAPTGTQPNPMSYGNSTLHNNILSSHYPFSNVSVPNLAPSAAIVQSQSPHGFTSTRVQNSVPNNNLTNYTAPITSAHVASTSFPVQQNSLADITLSTSHVAARQVMSKDLPSFSGNPEEWPLFITNFEQSTQRCGFTDQENLIRLQKCLKGPALDAVRGKLMMPSTVSFAIETLRMLYGRPDVIHQTLQNKLRQQPAVKTEKLDTLVNFALAVQNYRATMQAIGLEDYLNDPMLLNDLLCRLPCDLRLDWGRHRMTHGRVDITTFDAWLFNLATCASQVTPIEQRTTPLYASEERKGNRKPSKERVMLHDVRRAEGEICPKCSKPHCLSECGEFKALNVDMRWKFVRDSKLCIRCFKRHFIRRCNSKKKCNVDGCKMPHNLLLHSPHRNMRSSPESGTKDDLSRNTTVLFHDKENKCAIFRYIAVTLHGKRGSINTYAFIDEGSACTLIEDGLATELGLDGPMEELCLQWTGEVTQNEVNSKSVALHISARNPTSRKFLVKGIRTVTTLNLPVQTLDNTTIMCRSHLKDLPIEPYFEAQARILIGLDNIKLGVPLQIRERDGDDLVAAECKLGWSVYGRNGVYGASTQRVMHICTCSPESRMEELIKSHYNVESIGVKEVSPLLSKENERSQRIMDLTTKYISSEKRWETGLLWKYDSIQLPDSLPMAQRRLQCLEKRMSRDPNLSSFLVNTIKEYERKGYVRKLLDGEVLAGPKSWYIPIFTVNNPSKNKTRLVWDAAAAVGKTALNSLLLKGPDLMKSLLGILIRFRERPIALCGDIREMFHQIRIRQEDQASQKFLWREGETSKQPAVYVMQVMTFGATCSPSLANYVKNKNAARFETQYPDAVKAILDNTFVDDWLHSMETEDEMIKMAITVRNIHSDGGFEMRSWKSNSRNVLLAITGQSAQKDKSIDEPLSQQEKILGMWWSPAADVLTFSENFPKETYNKNNIPTKRQMLQVVMTIFDPLGLLGFYIVSAKILMQEVWRSGVAWDEPVRTEEQAKWWHWVERMSAIADIKVPRCYPLVSGGERIQLHTFVDASVDAFAALVYLRAEKSSKVSCCLVASKTRVAPLKPLSIPRLELMGAILGLRLAKFIATELSICIEKRVFWTDSKNVLCWIKSDARRFNQFVAMRIGEILEDSNADEWRWVPSGDNVADEGTKRMHNPEFDGAARWYVGPYFLSQPEEKWPRTDISNNSEHDRELVCHVGLKTFINSPWSVISVDPQRFSKWEKLRNAQRYVFKFLQSITKHVDLPHLSTLVKISDMADVECFIIRCCQEEAFADEIQLLRKGNVLSKHSVIYRDSPYLDKAGLLRVKGRVDAMKYATWDARRPIILPRKHRVSHLITEYYHRKFQHHHNEIVINEMRQRYCVKGLRALVREIAKNCQLCRNRKALPAPPEMGNIPAERFAAYERPFTNTGIDFFGPIEITVGRRREKRWGVVFTCLTIRAVHIEISNSLSTDSFLLVLKQFISRRGVPKNIWSDNGTNFRGASRVLQMEIERLTSGDLERRHPEIKWHFIPPVSPHMGGAWERMVRSIKSILMDILPKMHIREEVLRAALADVEYILNSRPLTYIPIDSPQMDALTPNHFLLGDSSGIREKGGPSSGVKDLGKNFRISSQISDQFWKRWIREYLPCLTRRAKWFEQTPKPLAVGDVVVVADDNLKRNTWPKGVVIDVHTSKDGQVRSAVVKTEAGLLTRPAVKLAKLDVKG